MRIKIGYLKKMWEEAGVLVDATIRSEGSTLISGMTGSGKTTLLWYFCFCLIRSLGDQLSLSIADFKQEHTILYNCPRYHFDVDDIVDVIDSFYQEFYRSRGNTGHTGLHCLVIDEFLSFMSFLNTLSKSSKEYKEIYQRITSEISSILAMGRSSGYILICIVQQANAASFSSTADRENFINKIAMGTQTATSASMIFDSADTSGIDYKKPMPIGCGYVSVQGDTPAIKEFIVPKIRNPDVMKQSIRSFLDCGAASSL